MIDLSDGLATDAEHLGQRERRPSADRPGCAAAGRRRRRGSRRAGVPPWRAERLSMAKTTSCASALGDARAQRSRLRESLTTAQGVTARRTTARGSPGSAGCEAGDPGVSFQTSGAPTCGSRDSSTAGSPRRSVRGAR